MNTDVPEIQYATRKFRPNLAFKLRIPASQRRAWAAFEARRNFRVRQGKQFVTWGPVAFNEELVTLRQQIAELQNRITIGFIEEKEGSL